MKIDRVNILGVQVSALNMALATQQIEEWIDARQPHYVCVTPAHCVMDGYHSPELRKIFNSSGMTTPDGMAIVWLLHLNGQKQAGRVYGPDLMQAICALSPKKNWRHFFYGGAPGVADELTRNLCASNPGLQIVGSYTPPFRELTVQEEAEVTALIQETRPDILWVGISSPKQERYMKHFVDRLNVPVLIGVGAAYDFLSGRKRQAPRWIQRSGLEWLFRFANEPRRLWRRYIQYPLFVILAVLQLLGLKKFNEY
jgi:N-acetylglucosaminyldiphosphoundecaprenol N-acetyl-beta-D-mannosaminyltransferase